MMKTVALVMGLALCDATFVAKIKNANAALLRRIAAVDCKDCKTDHGKVDMWEPDVVDASEVHESWKGDVDVRGGDELRELLKELDFEHIHEDFEAVVRAEKERLSKRIGNVAANATRDDWYDDYHPYNEIQDRLEYLTQQHTGVEQFSIGTTAENNQIFGIRFGSAAHNHSIWIQCGIHAREWIAPATCMYFTEKLLEMRNTDPTVAAILDNAEIYMIPVLNRDGYQFSWLDNRMWRKNRQPNAGGSIGTDLNRNWDSAWGGCGASTTPSSDTYRGTGPFSSPETLRVRDYIAQLKASGRHILGGHDFHSYGNLLLRPYGWTSNDSPNEAVEFARGASMVEAIAESSGQNYQNIKAFQLYCCSGLACDWLADQTTENSGFTFELRGNSFTLPPAEIVPSGEEIYAGMLVWFKSVAGLPLGN